ncbi:MAG: right-handed parallel beta-helix repeat-containing protein, partial [Candidatus Tenebribacter mawsonii]|nr:right-handed parallel beta-helix repeat-containing protein [Candidatus Tenebribacter mawsonii]
MKKMVFSYLMFILTISVFATDVSGNQSGTWNLAGSPYNIIGEITIPTNETLEIDAGVEVIASGNYKITALGNLFANGTLNDTIRFYGNGGLNWGGLRLEDEENESVFDYCRISNTDDTNDYGIHSINSPVLINHSYFDDHQKAISFSALSATTPSYMEIKNSKVAYVQKSGITVVDNSNVLIDSCEVTRCGLGASFYGAIQLSLQSNSHSCSPMITNNYIHHNEKQGITLANLFGYDNMAPIVEYNEVSYNYTGIYLYVGKGTYKWNHIHHNFVENNPDSGAGVMLYGNGADAVFTYNKVNNNYTGFYLTADATVNLGDLNNADPDDDGYNCIYDNIFYTGEEFSIYNASSADVTAENNVWDDDPAIDDSIIDGNDNPAYG